MARSWTEDEIIILKKMWAEGLSSVKIAKALGRTSKAIDRKKYLLKLPRRGILSIAKIKSKNTIPTSGTRKCHNCLEEIKLTKNGLDKDYRGATRRGEWIFWHFPGECPGNPNAHADLLQKRKGRRGRKDSDDPGRFY